MSDDNAVLEKSNVMRSERRARRWSESGGHT